MLKSKIFWLLTFALILIMMWVYLFFVPIKGIGLWGFPNWIYGFLFISAIYSYAVYLFSKHFWREAKDEDPGL
jgi:hypothetical protein